MAASISSRRLDVLDVVALDLVERVGKDLIQLVVVLGRLLGLAAGTGWHRAGAVDTGAVDGPSDASPRQATGVNKSQRSCWPGGTKFGSRLRTGRRAKNRCVEATEAVGQLLKFQ